MEVLQFKNITNKDVNKAKAILNRLDKKDKAGKDYVYTIGIGKDNEFLIDVLKQCDSSTVLLVSNDDEKEQTQGIIFMGEHDRPLLFGTIRGKIAEEPYPIDALLDENKDLKWCIGEIRTAKEENAKAIETESLLGGILLSFYI